MTNKELKDRKKQLLSSIRNDIKELEKSISEYSSVGLKKKSIIKKKLFLLKLKNIYPFVLAILGSSCFSYVVLDDIPFVLNDIKRKEHVKTVLDSFGDSSYERQYSEFSDERDILSSYSAWSFDDGMYSRQVDTYYCDGLSLENVQDIMRSLDFSNLEFRSNSVQKREFVSPDELKKDSYCKYTYYNVSDEYYTVPESEIHNQYYTFYWVLITLIFELGVSYWGTFISDFSYYSSVEKLYRYYLPNGSDIDCMKDILKNRVDNYNLLVKKYEKK